VLFYTNPNSPASLPILVQFKVLGVTHVRNHAGLANKTKNKIDLIKNSLAEARLFFLSLFFFSEFGYFQIAALMFSAPSLALLCPFFILILETTLVTLEERFVLLFDFSNHI